jgi:hypothetical protein
MQSVTLKVGQSEISTISQNRRHPEGTQETILKVLLAAAAGAAEPVATVMNYACHATVLEHDNMLYSADFPGVAASLVEHAVGGKAIYMQGTCGDINRLDAGTTSGDPPHRRHRWRGGHAHSPRTAAARREAVRHQPQLRKISRRAARHGHLGISLRAMRIFSTSRKNLPDIADIEAEIAQIEAQLTSLQPTTSKAGAPSVRASTSSGSIASPSSDSRPRPA